MVSFSAFDSPSLVSAFFSSDNSSLEVNFSSDDLASFPTPVQIHSIVSIIKI